MKKIFITGLILVSNFALAGNESGGGNLGIVAPELSEAVLWGGWNGDIANIKIGKFDSKFGWKIEDKVLPSVELQKIDFKVGNAINASALSKTWVQIK